MISVDDTTCAELQQLDITSSLPQTAKKSTFQAYCIKASNKEQVEKAYIRIRQLKPLADHIMVAYRFKDGDQIKQGCATDHEYYGDHEIMMAIQRASAVNVAVFVSREYGGIPLRGLHFEKIREVTTEVLRMVNHDVLPSTPPKQQQQSQALPQRTPKRPRGVQQDRGRGFDKIRGGGRGWGSPGRGARVNPFHQPRAKTSPWKLSCAPRSQRDEWDEQYPALTATFDEWRKPATMRNRMGNNWQDPIPEQNSFSESDAESLN